MAAHRSGSSSSRPSTQQSQTLSGAVQPRAHATETRNELGVHGAEEVKDPRWEPDPEEPVDGGLMSDMMGSHGDSGATGKDAGEKKGGVEGDGPMPTRYCYMLSLLACLNSCNLGYDVGSVGGAAILMREQLGWNTWELSVFVGSINFFSIFGALNAGYVCDKLGRRLAFTVSCVIFIVGLVLQIATGSFIAAMVGRFFVGVGVGLGLALAPWYITELAPPWNRGHLVSFSEIAINLGTMLGFIADFVFLNLPPGWDWRVMLGLGMVLPAILIVLTFTVLPESPRWLLMQGRVEEAQAILKRVYPPGTDVEEVALDIATHLRKEEQRKQGATWKVILCPDAHVRPMLLAGVGLAACQQISGSEAFIYFSPELLKRAGFSTQNSAFGMACLIGICKMLFTLVSVFQADKFGRRPLLLLSTAGLFVFLLMMALVAPYTSLSGLMVFAMCAYISCFSVAIGPLCWVGATEVFPTHIRAKAMSLATAVNRLISGLVAATTLPLTEVMGQAGYFFLYAALTALSGVYIYYLFPETKGRSLESLDDYFEGIAERKSDLWSQTGMHLSWLFGATQKDLRVEEGNDRGDKQSGIDHSAQYSKQRTHRHAQARRHGQNDGSARSEGTTAGGAPRSPLEFESGEVKV